MYADVMFQVGLDEQPTVAVLASAVIDSGARQVVLVAKGEGRFEPRPVKLGRRGDGYVEILKGLAKGEEVVSSATFLIDAESNLKAALQAFSQPEAPK
jgi:Cu(I)/Ag(I) efflux system membrane fusion protein